MLQCGPGGPLTILKEDVEQDDADLVVGADVGIQQDWHNGTHGVLDLLALSVSAHGKVLEGNREGRDRQRGQCLQQS